MAIGIVLTAFSDMDLLSDPLRQFARWYDEACACSQIAFANAMCLSTIDAHGYPDARMVLLKSFDKDGFRFYTNTKSAKGVSLSALPRASLTFYWDPLGRQIRIKGDAALASNEEADAYFAARERASQLGAWASDQSRPLESKETLIKKVAHFSKTYQDLPIPRPPHWTGYSIKPLAIEFWQAGGARLHDRFLYTLERDQTWKITRLYP